MKKLFAIVTSKEFWFGIWFAIIALAMIFVGASINSATAQTVVRKGNTFYQKSNSNKIEKDSVTFTGYHYFDTKGIRYPIYISSKGKCFIIRTSSKTGKHYKQYLPEVTKQLSNGRK